MPTPTDRPVLVFICRDEMETLPRLLRSLKGHVSGVVFVDTGSVDGTFEWLMDNASKIVSMSELYVSVIGAKREWVDFSTARNQALQAARTAYPSPQQWFLLADCDWEFEGQIPQFPAGITTAAYTTVITGHSQEVTHPVLIRGADWYWYGAVHEGLYTKSGAMPTDIATGAAWFRFHHHSDSGSRKHRDDVKMLTRWAEDYPQDGRARFYLAQTYYERGEYANAETHYAIRVGMGGFPEEVWYSTLMVGRCLDALSKWGDALLWYLRAAQDSTRPEPVFHASGLLRHQGMYQTALGLISAWHFRTQSMVGSPDTLFANRWMANYGIACEAAISQFYVRGPMLAKHLFEGLAARDDLSPEYAELIQTNITLCNTILNGK